MRRRRASDIPSSVCQSKISAAWISPKGKIIPLPGGLTHGEWALKRQMKRGLYDHLYSFDDDDAEESQDSATSDLLMEGWVRVSTWDNLEVWRSTPESARAMVSLVLGCFSSNSRIRDPEKVRVYVTTEKGDNNLSLAQLAKRYEGEDLLDKMYESLLARVAGEGHANQNGPTLYDQANPTDSQTHYQGELNDNPNNLAMPPGNTIMEEGRSDMNPSSTRVIPDSLQKIQASSRVARRFLSARAKPVLVFSDEHTDYDNDPWELAREVGVRVLSNKDLRAMYVSGSEVVAALFDSSDSSGYEFDIAVSPSWQKFGLGSRLMDLAISLYEDNSEAYGEDYVLKADVISHVAEKMLRQRGFVEIGREPGHVIMTRRAHRLSRGAKTAATIPEILGGTDPSILGKTSGVSLKQRLFNPDRGFWMFTATGSKGEQYTVRLKASPKGTGKKVGSLPVRVSCSCPFFRWQGPEHWASQENYLWGKPVGTASKPVVKDPSSTHRVCKHVAAALEAAKKYRISTVSKWSLSGPIHSETVDSRIERFLERHPDLKRFGRRIGFREKETGSGEARQHGNEIWLFPKFWELSEEEQDFVLAHEIGHWVIFNFGLLEFGRLASKLGIDVWDTSSLPFAQYNQEEAFADCFASFYLDGGVEKRYPAWSTLVREISGSVG